jgi:pimeloyl-ACP methyl ester carboxylesterase
VILETVIGLPVAGSLVYALGYAAWAGARWPAIGDYFTVDGVRLHGLRGGDPDDRETPVVFLHGASSNAREWLTSVTPALGSRRWLALDRPGLGWSDAPTDGHRLATQAALIAGAVRAAGFHHVIVVGHSLGSASALRLALDEPGLVAGLVLAAPATHPYPGENSWHVQVAAHPILGPLFVWLLTPIFGPLAARGAAAAAFAPAPAPDHYAEATGLALLFRPWTFRANALQVRATNPEFAVQAPRYPNIVQPVIILTADKDHVVSPKLHAQALAAALPHAELVTIVGAGHMPHQVRPDLVINAIETVATRANGL